MLQFYLRITNEETHKQFDQHEDQLIDRSCGVPKKY